MNRDEAKFILQSYATDGRDANDPQFREALELTKHDPELAAWFAEEQRIDARLSDRFRSFPVPPQLQAQLLAARKIVSVRPWWRQTTWISAAAVFVVLIGLAAFFVRPAGQPQFSDFRSYVAATAHNLDHLDISTTNVVEARQWLAAHYAPADFKIPVNLSDYPTVGCRAFNWKGEHVSLVCFNVEGKGTVHLFVIDRSKLRNIPAAPQPDVQTSPNGIATVAWSNNQRVYVLAGTQNTELLKTLL